MSASASTDQAPPEVLEPITTKPWERTPEMTQDPNTIIRFDPCHWAGGIIVWQDSSGGWTQTIGRLQNENVDEMKLILEISIDPQTQSYMAMNFYFPITEQPNLFSPPTRSLHVSLQFMMRSLSDMDAFGPHVAPSFELPACVADLGDAQVKKRYDNKTLMMFDISLKEPLVITHIYNDVELTHEEDHARLEQLKSLSKALNFKIICGRVPFLDLRTVEGKQIARTLAAERASTWHFEKLDPSFTGHGANIEEDIARTLAAERASMWHFDKRDPTFTGYGDNIEEDRIWVGEKLVRKADIDKQQESHLEKGNQGGSDQQEV